MVTAALVIGAEANINAPLKPLRKAREDSGAISQVHAGKDLVAYIGVAISNHGYFLTVKVAGMGQKTIRPQYSQVTQALGVRFTPGLFHHFGHRSHHIGMNRHTNMVLVP